jgi:hypothetical protein
MSLCYVLLVFVIASVLCFIGVYRCLLVAFYWCLLSSPCCVLLVFIVTFLLHFVDIRCDPLIALYLCLSSPFCYILLMFIMAPLMHSISAHCHFLAMFSWCLLAPPCYILLVLIDTHLLCSIGTSLTCFIHRHSFVMLYLLFINVPLLCFIGAPWDSKLVFPLAYFFASVQVWKLNFFHNTSSDIHKQQGMFLFYFFGVSLNYYFPFLLQFQVFELLFPFSLEFVFELFFFFLHFVVSFFKFYWCNFN